MPRVALMMLNCGFALFLAARVATAGEVAPFVVPAVESPDDVSLARADGPAATIYVDAGESAVVRHTTRLLSDDVKRVTGVAPSVSNDAATLEGVAVLVGTVGQSPVLDRLIAEGKVDGKSLAGQWETFVIQTVANPLPDVAQALVIAGSDRRGTAFGIFELSEQIGVSPWYWWADVTPARRDQVVIKSGTYRSASPTVKYRGIFINDEDWGLQPWAAKTFDPEFGDIGPKTYEKVFELLLRLKGNYLWPAMHHCSTEFGAVDRNVTLADEWGIVMGAAHCEPLNRNNVWWSKDGQGEWRYDTNRANVRKYWEEWARKRGDYEAVWTVGMRGIHDTAMPGPRDMPSQVRLLEEAIADQRALLKKYVDPKVESIPQVFTPYKEALAHYRNGLTLPDDVTILWCEDNYGYIRQLSTPDEQKRVGGSGIYYHISYLGWPRPYLWLNTTPPALIWSEMTKALDYGADRIWVVNVGDIKPGEIGAEFWMKLAWNGKRYGPDAQTAFLREWAARDFGDSVADEVAGIMNDYYRLGYQRKPELLDDSVFNVVNYGEAERRLAEHRAMRQRAESIYEQLPAEKRDGFYQLVLYPVRTATLLNEAFVNSDLSRLYARQGRIAANEYADQTDAAVAAVQREADYFNNGLANGKWKHMMTVKGIAGDWNVRFPKGSRVVPADQNVLGVVVEGQVLPVGTDVQSVEPGTDIDIDVEKGSHAAAWKTIKTDDGMSYVVVPNGAGDVLQPEGSPAITYTFDVPADGSYRLFMHINCPNDKDDSFFIRIDDQSWMTWNNMGTRSTWDWRQQGEYRLKKGAHTLTIAQREDGSMLRGIRLTDRATATRLQEEFPSNRPVEQLPVFDRRAARSRHYIDLFNSAEGSFPYLATADQPWIRISQPEGTIDAGTRLWVEVDWSNAPDQEQMLGTVTIAGAGVSRRVEVKAVNRAAASTRFVETDGHVAIEAEHFTRSTASDEVAWQTVVGLGRTGDAVRAVPTNAPSRADLAAVLKDPILLEYDFEADTAGPVKLIAYCLPTQRTHEGRGLRYAVAIGDETPQIVNFHEDGGASGEHSAGWRNNVTRNVSQNQTTHAIARPGKQTLRLWMVDPGVVIDKLVIDTGGLRTSELGPPETRAASEAGQ